MKLKAHTRYKPVQSLLIDQIPSHWSMRRNKLLFHKRSETVGGDSGRWRLLSLTNRGIVEREIENNFGKFPASFESYQGVHPSDLVFCLFDIDETPRTVGISPLTGMVTGAYCVYRCSPEADPRFVYWFYLHIDQRKGLRPYYTGLRKVVRPETFGNIEMPTPPIPAQKAIADFLDRKTGAIDALIEKKQTLLDLLAEKRAALINQAVTKGLDPNVPMKDSGIPWIGEIPAHWEVVRAKHISDVYVPQRNKPVLNRDVGVPWVTLEDLSNPVVEDSRIGLRVSSKASREAGSSTVEMGAVIAACVGSFGTAAVAGAPVIINQQLQAYIPHAVEPHFLRLRLSASSAYFVTVATTTTISYVNKEKFGELPLPLPPCSEQAKIVADCEQIELLLGRMKDSVSAQVELLQEYRQALITAAVTGQLDIGEEVPA